MTQSSGIPGRTDSAARIMDNEAVDYPIAQRRRDLLDRVARAAESVGRDPASVTLIAASKQQPLSAIQAAYDAGQRDFGESRLQEALPKIEAMPEDITWHFLGRLQSNKARRVAEVFQVIHTLDNARQLAEIARGSSTVIGLVEVNVAQEPQKGGIGPSVLDSFYQEVLNCGQVLGKGLMTIGPFKEDPEAMRPFFRSLRKCASRLPGECWLSMGMSQDFDVAIQEGSTHIRVGTALFGPRT